MRKTISIPKPKKLDNGTYVGQVMVNGERKQIYGKTIREYESNVLTFKKTKPNKIDVNKQKLKQLLKSYIDKNELVLSPTSIRSYDVILRNRFVNYMDMQINKIDWQEMINEECKLYAPKTVKNSWGLVSAALKDLGITPIVKKPKQPVSDKPFLDPDQIKIFLKAIRGTDAELASILALHSLRISELLPLTVDDIKNNSIIIRKAEIRSINEEHLVVNLNKTNLSTRDIPIFIDRLYEILPKTGKLVNIRGETINKIISRICIKNNLPICTCHDLRRSFCSLGFFLGLSEQTVMQIGGWSNMQTVNNVYRKLSQQQKNSDIQKLRDYYSITI